MPSDVCEPKQGTTPEETAPDENQQADASTATENGSANDPQPFGQIENALKSAGEAFDEADFDTAIGILDELPSGSQSEQSNELYDRACRGKHAAEQFEAAKRQFDEQAWEDAIRLIAEIPQVDRHEECRELEETAQLQLRLSRVLAAAGKKIDNHEYEEAVRLVEEVPEADRTRELAELLTQAADAVEQMEKIWTQIDGRLQEAEQERTWEKYEPILPLLDQIESIRPEDRRALTTRKDIVPLEERFRQRDLLLEAARRCFEHRDYDTTDEILQKIPEDDRCRRFTDLSIQNEKRRAKVAQLSEDLAGAFARGDVLPQSNALQELQELQFYPVERFIAETADVDFRKGLKQLVTRGDGAQPCRELLEQYCGAVSSEWVLDFVGNSGDELIAALPTDSAVLHEKLCDVLHRLHEDASRLRERLAQLQEARALLGDEAAELADWDRLLDAEAHFRELHAWKWRRLERWFENEKSNQLDEAARELAVAAKAIIPADTDLWELLTGIAGAEFQRKDRVYRRAYAKIDAFATQEEWPDSPLVLLTAKRLITFAGIIVATTVLGLAGSVLFSLFFSVGGMLGAGMAVFLGALWAFFYFAADKVL